MVGDMIHRMGWGGNMVKQYDRCRVISGDYIGEMGKVYSTWYDSASVLLDIDKDSLNGNLDSLLFAFKQNELEKI